MLNWLYDDWDIHLLNMPLNQVMVTGLIKGEGFYMGTPCNYTAVKPGNCPRNLIRFAASVSLIGLKDAKNKVKNSH